MSGNWPLHPLPLDDELLSDWIRRIAKSYAVSYQVFCRKVLNLTREEILLLDDDPNGKALEILSKGTGQSIEDLREMTVPARCRRFRAALERGDSDIMVPYTKLCRDFGEFGLFLK